MFCYVYISILRESLTRINLFHSEKKHTKYHNVRIEEIPNSNNYFLSFLMALSSLDCSPAQLIHILDLKNRMN